MKYPIKNPNDFYENNYKAAQDNYMRMAAELKEALSLIESAQKIINKLQNETQHNLTYMLGFNNGKSLIKE
jgi:Ni,Fe-hydrogenase I large subunit